MMLIEVALILIYTCVLLIRSCYMSPSVCATYGFGDKPEGAAFEPSTHAVSASSCASPACHRVCVHGVLCRHLPFLRLLRPRDGALAADHRGRQPVDDGSGPKDSAHCERTCDFSLHDHSKSRESQVRRSRRCGKAVTRRPMRSPQHTPFAPFAMWHLVSLPLCSHPLVLLCSPSAHNADPNTPLRLSTDFYI